MKKLSIILLLLVAFKSNAQQIGARLLIGSSTAKIGNKAGNYKNGNGQMSYSIGLFSDIKLKGKLYFTPELLFTSHSLNYQFNITDAFGVPYTYNEFANARGLEVPLQLKLKGKKAYISIGAAPFINSLKFDTFYSASTGLLIGKHLSMDIKYNHGIIAHKYVYKTEALTVGVSYLF